MSLHVRSSFSPNGKQRVLIAAHPADLATFEDTYAKWVLDLRNCAVYTLEDAAKAGLSLREQVLGAQLLMIPVTRSFLAEDCPARQAMEAALEGSVPVLLIQEVALEGPEDWERFNRVCHRLQALNPHASADGGSDFGQKLSAFVDSVMVDDALAERIRRDAFDDYLFISYRKQDIGRTKALMRLIHDLPGCVGLSLWFDEYLPIGRDFEASIVMNMDNSSLVVLVVTPHINEPKNYVLREYAMARERGMEVLPVQAAPTDPGEVARLYPGIGPFFDPDAPQALLERLAALPGRAKVSPGEQRYLLGLAYLKGIQVEKDIPRGLGLLEESLLRHLYRPAGRLLRSMYTNGVDVPRDLKKAQEYSNAIPQTYGAVITEAFTRSADYPEFLRDRLVHARLIAEDGKEDLAIRQLKDIGDEALWVRRELGADTDALAWEALRQYRLTCEKVGRYKEGGAYLDLELALESTLSDASARDLSLEHFRDLLARAKRTVREAKPEQGQAMGRYVMEALQKRVGRLDEAGDYRRLGKAMLLTHDAFLTILELEYQRFGILDAYESRLAESWGLLRTVIQEQREEAEGYDLARRLARLWGRCSAADGDFSAARDLYGEAARYARRCYELRQDSQADLDWFDARLDAHRAAVATGAGDPFSMLNRLAELSEQLERLHKALYNRPEMKRCLAKHALLAEEVYIQIGELGEAAKNAGLAYNYAQSADLRDPENLLICLTAYDSMQRAGWPFPEEELLQNLLEMSRTLAEDFPENAGYQRRVEEYQARLVRLTGSASVQPGSRGDARALARLLDGIMGLPAGTERLMQLYALIRDLEELRRERPGDAAVAQLRERVRTALERDAAALERRARALGYGDAESDARQKENVEEAVRIYDALLMVFPGNEDLTRDRRMIQHLLYLRMKKD